MADAPQAQLQSKPTPADAGAPPPTEALARLRSMVGNARNVEEGFTGFLLEGLARSGKTMQTLTLPRPCLSIVTDPNTMATLRGHDIDTIEFAEDGIVLGLKGGKQARPASAGIAPRPAAFESLWRFLQDGRREGLLQEYRSVVLDSMTGLQNIVMDAVLWDAGKSDRIPEADEYVRLTNTITPILRELRSLPGVLAVMAHVDPKTDRGGALRGYQLSLVGKLRQAIPALCSDIYFCRVEGGRDALKYIFQTRPYGFVDVASTTLASMPPEFDATIRDLSKPHEYGLGRVLAAIRGERPLEAPKAAAGGASK